MRATVAKNARNRLRVFLLLFVFFAAVLVVQAERLPLERYQSIIGRQMFGPLPPDFDPTKSPSEVKGGSSRGHEDKELTKEQEKLKSSVRFSLINVEGNGDVRVGFTDNSDPKLPLHYYLKVGEEKDGWVVKEADAEEATMTIAKGEVEVFLSLGGDSSKSSEATRANAQSGGGETMTRMTLGSRRHQRQVEGFAELRKKMEEDNAKRAEEEEKREAERKQEAAANREQLEALAKALNDAREEKKKLEESKKEESGEGEKSE